MRKGSAILLVAIAVVAGTGFFSIAPESLEVFADHVMASTLDRPELVLESLIVEQDIAALPDATSRAAHGAQLLFLLAFAERGFVSQGSGSEDAADRLFLMAADLARDANRLEETSTGYRVLADCLNQLLDLRGIGYRMFNIKAARSAADCAVGLDPENPLARTAAAAFYSSAPRAVGGDPEQAICHLEQAVIHRSGRPHVDFLTHLWFGKAYLRDGRTLAATSSFRAAAAIFPENWALRRMAEDAGIPLPLDR